MPICHARRSTVLAPARALTLAGVTLACALTPTAANAAGTPPGCLPADGLRSADVARAARPDGGSEVTEFAQGGGYRVTVCDKAGRLAVSQTVSPILGPDGTAVLVPTERQEPGVTVAMLYGDPTEPGWAAGFRASRAAVAASVIRPTVAPATPPAALPLPAAPAEPGATAPGNAPNGPAAPTDAAATPSTASDEAPRGPKDAGATTRRRARGGQIASAAVSGDACSNSQYSFFQSAFTGRWYGYYVNRSRFNYNDTSVGSVVSGHWAWDTTSNSCGYNDITNLTSQHLGSTSSTIHTNPDGASVTDKGSLASVCPGALACTWLFTSGSSSTETDQRYNEDYTFSNVGAAGAYDYQSISAHESGHSIGLDHANSSNALTMYYQIAAGTTHARSLARGDVLGLRARYP